MHYPTQSWDLSLPFPQIQQRRAWAKEEGLNADAIEKMYQDLVNHFIDEEMKHWKQSKKE